MFVYQGKNHNIISNILNLDIWKTKNNFKFKINSKSIIQGPIPDLLMYTFLRNFSSSVL